MPVMDETAYLTVYGGDRPAPETTAVYAHALRHGGITEGDERPAAELGLSAEAFRAAVAELKELHLLRERSSGAPMLVPVAPDIASATRILPIDEEVHRHQATISRLRRNINAFRPEYLETRGDGESTPSLLEVSDAEQLAAQLYLSTEECESEYVAFLPNAMLTASDGAPLRMATTMLGLLNRGVRVRMLLQHAVRSDIRVRKVLAELLEAGAEIRTAGQLPNRLTVYDARVAFLLQEEVQTSGQSTGVMIRSASAVRVLMDLIESAWADAHPYAADEIGYREVIDSLHRTIIQLLAEGLTDEAVARRLGISVRTCRRHIAAVLRDLDAVSRFQAGVRVGVARRAVPPPV